MLHVKEKEGVYLRLVLIRQSGNIFLEKYCGWEDWAALRGELGVLREEINSLIKSSRMDEARRKTFLQKDVLLKLMRKTGLEDAFQQQDLPGLDVFYGKSAFLLPFESLSENIFVRNFIHGRKRNRAVAGGGITMVYSEDLEYARDEAAGIAAAVKEKFPTEIYSDRLYDLHRAGPRSGSVFHFAGHGTVTDGKGRIHIGQEKLDAFLYRQDTELAFLNCCHVGSVADGIVTSLLNEGAGHVIASSYQIPDKTPEEGQNSTIADFYRDIDTGNIGQSWRQFCQKNPYFGRFFRFFSSY